jgi:hypothetical protein
MTVRKLNKAEWQPFLDTMSRMLEGKQAEIETVSLALGDQVDAEWLPLLGITYDPKGDLIEIALEGLDHMIRKPRAVYVDDDVGGLTGLAIVGDDGVEHIVKLRDPLMLPAPGRVNQA